MSPLLILIRIVGKEYEQTMNVQLQSWQVHGKRSAFIDFALHINASMMELGNFLCNR